MIALNLLAIAIGTGLLYTLLLTEAFGIAAGGLVVPGYMALKLLQPASFALTIAVALATFAVVRSLSAYTVIYGRRMTALTILTGYLLGAAMELAVGGGFAVGAERAAEVGLSAGAAGTLEDAAGEPVFLELGVIGYIIPGLIALWFHRQGILQTLSGLLVTSVLVRLSLIALLPETVMAYEAEEAMVGSYWSLFFGGKG